MNSGSLKLFAINSIRSFGERVAASLQIQLAPHEERDFEDGEHKIRSLCNVRNRDVFVMQSLYGDDKQSVNDKLCRLLFLIGSLKDSGAARVVAVLPFLCYSRKDRKTKSRDPVTTRYVARILEAVGAGHVVTIDVHNLAAYQNSFHAATTDHLVATGLFASHFVSVLTENEKENLVVASPDAGGIKRAEKLRSELIRILEAPVGHAFMQKGRSGDVVTGGQIVGDISGKTVIFVDDMICSGTTLALASHACRDAHSGRVFAAATHAAFSNQAEGILGKSALDQIVVTDTIPIQRPSPSFVDRKIQVLPAANLFAQAIHCIHSGDSIVDLLPPD